MPKFSGFQFNRPQQLAAVLLLLLVGQCLWVFHRQTLTSRDYDFARCGREMWEKPDPLAGYFTTCGNIPDGTLGYRIAGLPLTLQRVLARQAPDTSTLEMRHELGYVLVLLHCGFLLTGILHAIGGPLLPSVAATFHLNDRQSGFLFLLYFAGSSLGALLCIGSYVEFDRLSDGRPTIELVENVLIPGRGYFYDVAAILEIRNSHVAMCVSLPGLDDVVDGDHCVWYR